MTSDTPTGPGGQAESVPDAASKPETPNNALTPAARRALAEAEARRRAREAENRRTEPEVGGRGGADPARYGDWEIKGRAIDF